MNAAPQIVVKTVQGTKKGGSMRNRGSSRERTRGWRFSVVAAVTGVLCLAVVVLAQTAGKTVGAAASFFDPAKLPFNVKVLRPDMKVDFPDWPKDSTTGTTVERLSGPKLGVPRDKLPGVKFMKAGESAQLDMSRHASGLYVVGVDFVPADLPRAMKAFGYTLRPDGKLLDRNREPIVALVTSEVYLIGKPGEPAKTGEAGPSRSFDLFATLSDLLVPRVEAASPFPWRCYSFTPWAVYHGGFHRWYDARTWASAYGADGSGGCSWASPLTNINYIQTRAAVGWPGNEDHCFGCNSEYSRDIWDVGYFWPAHGVPTTTHSGVWADGSFSFSRVAHLTW